MKYKNNKLFIGSIIVLLITLFIILFFVKNKNQSEYFFQKYKSITSILQTKDKNFLISGKTYDHGAFLAKVNQNGNILWEQTFGGFNRYSKFPIILNDDIKIVTTNIDDIIVAINTNISYDIDKKIKRVRFLKFNKYGKYIYWDKLFGEKNVSTYISDIAVLPDNGFVAILVILRDNSEKTISKIVRFDINGNKIWEQSFKKFTSKDIYLTKIFKTQTGYMALGSIRNLTNRQYKTVFIKLDKNGNILNSKIVDIFLDVNTNNIVKSDNGYTFISNLKDISKIIQFDKDGNILWQKSLNNKGKTIYAMIQTKQKGFAIVGRYYICKKKCNFLLLLDKNAKIIKEQRFGGKFWDKTYDIIETKENFIVIGSNLSHFKNKNVAWMIKLKKFYLKSNQSLQ